jgi:carbon monoxide dehydrogenase subunit G
MDMTNSVTLPSAQARVWEALNDPAILKQCINGCESIEKTGENEYNVAMTVAIGPVKAKFKGNLRLTDIDPPNAYTLQFDGQGGVAGFGKGSAKVTLTPEDTGTRLAYMVNAQIGGKIAQLGSRLIDGVSRKMADDFFEAFSAVIAPAEAGAVAGAAPGAPPVSGAGGLPRQWRWLSVAAAVVAMAAMAAWYLLVRR